jgi:hypothetical protein
MLPSRAARLRSVDRRTRVSGVLTLVAFAVAASARFAVDHAVAGSGSGVPQRYSTTPTSGWTAFDTVNVVAGVGASAAGLGVLLFGATLVLAVGQHRDRRLPVWLGAVTALMALGAVVAAVVATSATDFTTAMDASILRTALAGLAAASLPAVCLAALRSRARR